MGKGTFVTAINCMDGRVQKPIVNWMKEKFGADYVDMITEAGPDKIMAKGPYNLLVAIRDRVLVSVNAHGSKVAALVSHHDCAGNPVSKETHMEHLEKGFGELGSWVPDIRILGLWVNESWKVEVIFDSKE